MPDAILLQRTKTVDAGGVHPICIRAQHPDQTEHPLQRFEPRGRTTVEGSTLPEPFGQHEPERGL